MKKFNKWRKKRKYQRTMNKAIFFFVRLDVAMKDNNWPRYKRRQFWRDFIKSPKARDSVLRQVLEEVNEL